MRNGFNCLFLIRFVKVKDESSVIPRYLYVCTTSNTLSFIFRHGCLTDFMLFCDPKTITLVFFTFNVNLFLSHQSPSCIRSPCNSLSASLNVTHDWYITVSSETIYTRKASFRTFELISGTDDALKIDKLLTVFLTSSSVIELNVNL